MEFWKALTNRLKAEDFSDEYIQVLLKGFGHMPAEDFVRLTPGELAEAITADWRDHHGNAGLDFMAAPDDAADLLQIAGQVLQLPEVKPQVRKKPKTDSATDGEMPVTFADESLKAKEENIVADELAQKTQKHFIVSGTISQDDRPLPAVVIKAVDRELRREQLLGEAITDEKGSYQISYSAKDFAGSQKKTSPNLIIRAFAPDAGTHKQALLGKSEIIFNATEKETVNLVVERQEEPDLSEFDKLLTELAPVLQNVPLADLTSEDVKFLSGNTGIDQTRIEMIKKAAQLSRETGLPTEAFFGFARQHSPLPLDLKVLLQEDPPVLLQALETAIEHKIIPAGLIESLDEIMEQIEQLRIEHGFLVVHELIGQLNAKEDSSQKLGPPLTGFAVHMLDMDAYREPKDIGYDTTDERGLFTMAYTSSSLRSDDDTKGAERKFRLDVFDRQGQQIHQAEIAIQAGKEDILLIPVPVFPSLEPASPKLIELEEKNALKFPSQLLETLATHGIHTLSDIYKAGGLSHLKDLPVKPDDNVVQILEAHAKLGKLSSDVQVNAALIEKNFTDVPMIAAKPRAEFVDDVHGKLGDFKAAQLHVEARARVQFMGNVLTGMRADEANGFAHEINIPALNKQFPQQCGCKDCDAAVSPAAYLSDLFNYTLTYVRNNNSAIDLGFLEATFRQPFGDLPASCAAVTEQVRQVRLCVEVLRRILRQMPIDSSQRAAIETVNARYCLAAYQSLLIQIGTSHEELRLEQDSAPLADRLGIRLSDATGSNELGELAKLSLDPRKNHPDPQALTEHALERLFGLTDTTRDPFSTGAKSGDDREQIIRWALEGVAWKNNTDREGRVYGSLTRTGNISRVKLYRDRDRSLAHLVAEGEVAAKKGAIILQQAQSSGLSGTIELDYIEDQAAIEFAVVPELLSWRLDALRKDWSEQDWPEDPYLVSADFRLPVVDPDLIGPDDMRALQANDRVSRLWRIRRNWVDGQLQELAGMKRGRRPDLNAMLGRMYKEIYYPDAGSSIKPPWGPSFQPEVLFKIKDQLARGTDSDVEEAQEKIKGLRLTVEALNHLTDVWSKDKLWWQDPRNKEVSEEEWGEVRSILVQAQKLAIFSAWVAEEDESDKAIELIPALFWVSLREPNEGEWPASRGKGQPWIDPDLQDADDLPESAVGSAARQFLETRRQQLIGLHEELSSAHTGGTFESLLVDALGDPPIPTVTWTEKLDELESELVDSNLLTREEASSQIETGLYMGSEEFNYLIRIKKKEEKTDPAEKPTLDEFDEIYSLLARVKKIRKLYPTWIQQEDAASLRYWHVRKALLPRWRASTENRRRWQEALRERIRIPIIDPDLVRPIDLRVPIAGGPSEIREEREELLEKIRATIQTSRPASAHQHVDWLDHRLTDKDLHDPSDPNIVHMHGVGLNATEIDELAEAGEYGGFPSGRLEQLNLTRAELANLLQVRELLRDTQTIDEDWNNVYDILVQVEKRRWLFPEWRKKERAVPLVLGPDHFVRGKPFLFVFPPPEPELLNQWRATGSERRRWEDILKSRIDQKEAIYGALAAAVNTAEEASLTMLRDGLLEIAARQGTTLAGKAKWFTDHLLIDAKEGSCRMTTRISQAIETVQGLLWSLRTRQLNDTYPDLMLQTDNFDEEWQWIGSYASWRAAMMAFLYPENILLPTLRRRDQQTPAFRQLTEHLRANSFMTAKQVCEAAQIYTDYFRDVANLIIDATCHARTHISRSDCEPKEPGGDTYRDLFYMFARGGETGKVYWSACDPDDDLGYPQRFWETVPGFDNVINVVGSVTYQPREGQHYLYLFAVTQSGGPNELVFIRYDLEKQTWPGEPTSLDLPQDTNAFTAVVKQTCVPSRPQLVIRSETEDGPQFYTRLFNTDGTDWEETDPKPLRFRDVHRTDERLKEIGAKILAMHDMSENWYPGTFLLLVETKDSTYYAATYIDTYISLIGEKHWMRVGNWKHLRTARPHWLGLFRQHGTNLFSVFWRAGSGPTYRLPFEVSENAEIVEQERIIRRQLTCPVRRQLS